MEKHYKRILDFSRHFERVMVISLLLVMMYIVFLAVVDLILDLPSAINFHKSGADLIEGEALGSAFASMLVILIGLELLDTVKMYLRDNVIHVEVVFLVAMISVSRHIIEMNFEKIEPMAYVGVSAVVLSLCSGYFLLKKSHSKQTRI